MSLDRLKQEQELCEYLRERGASFQLSPGLTITDRQGNDLTKKYGDFVYGEDQRLWRDNHYLGARIAQTVYRQLRDLGCDLIILPVSILGCKGPDLKTTEIGFRLVRGMIEREFYNNQFEDITDREHYSTKYDEALRKYVYSFPFGDIVHSSDWDLSGKETRDCSKQLFGDNWKEMTDNSYSYYEPLNSYSIREVKTILENYLNPYVIAMVLGEESSVNISQFYTKDGYQNFVSFKRFVRGKEETYAISFNNKQLFKVEGKKLMISLGNAHDYLFKTLKLPITTVLNTVAEVFCPRLLPGEGQTINEKDDKLLSDLRATQHSSGYEEIYREYVKVPYTVSEK